MSGTGKSTRRPDSSRNGSTSVSASDTVASHPGIIATPRQRTIRRLLSGAIVLAVLGIVLATYLPALKAGALYMDDKFYLGAPEIRQPGLASVKTFFGEVFAPSVVKGYYQPLALVSLMLDFLDPAAANNLLPFHRTTVLLHLLNVALVRVMLFLLFGNWFTAALLGLLYGLHPINVDAILWIAERKQVLSTSFALGSIVCYILYAQRAGPTGHREWKRYCAALVLYAGAVLAKPTAVPVAVLLLVLDYWPLERLSCAPCSKKYRS